MSVPHVLLGLLEDGPRHGYELKREYDTLFAYSKPLRFGQVYSTLARLRRDGLIDVSSEEPGRGPDRKLYGITDDGASDLNDWLARPESAEPFIQNVLFMKVCLALLSGRSAQDYLELQRAEHQRRMRELTRMKSDENDPATALLADYALFHLEADLRWIDLAEARLDRLRKEIGA
ncbi:MAG: PadR family transcriptional regulator [Actinomycetota bacterium]|nr:PadR family transcriptional regulator [Actinomycetota bacterium]